MSNPNKPKRKVESDEPKDPSRRRALQSAIRFSAVLTSLGLSAGAVLAGKDAQAKGGGCEDTVPEGVQTLINYAISKGSMEAAVELYGPESGLSDDALASLLTISAEDLAAVSSLADIVTDSMGDCEVSAELECRVICHVDDVH